jgi:hypothetical protein
VDRVIDRGGGQFTIVRRPWRDAEFCSSAVERRYYYQSNIDGQTRGYADIRTLYVHARLAPEQCSDMIESFDRTITSELPFARDIEQLSCTERSAQTCFNALETLRTFADSRAEWTNVLVEWRGRYLPWRSESGDHRLEGFDRRFAAYLSRPSTPTIDLRETIGGLGCVRAVLSDFWFEIDEAASVTMCQAPSFEGPPTTYLSLRQAPVH